MKPFWHGFIGLSLFVAVRGGAGAGAGAIVPPNGGMSTAVEHCISDVTHI
jgi:hypothetical protein